MTKIVHKNGCAHVQCFYHETTSTITYVVSDSATRKAAIIDPVLDYDMNAGRTNTRSADHVVKYVTENSLDVDWILETHSHADHLTAAGYLKKVLGGQIGIGEKIATVQRFFKDVFNLGNAFQAKGAEFDRLFQDGEAFSIGSLHGQVLHTPGHTPACVTYRIGQLAFVGDTVFMPEFGTARCDFPGGDAVTLYKSIRKILALPLQTVLYVGHEYPQANTEPRFRTTVAEQRAGNIHANDSITEAEFVEMRAKRDSTLAMPALIIPAIQVNIRAGRFPRKGRNGICYLKIPLNTL